MKIIIFGSDYVGLVTGTCFAEMGNTVTCVGIDEQKVNGLNNGIIPIYEPGLSSIIKHNLEKNRIGFTVDAVKAVKSAQVISICVGTPPMTGGSTDLAYVYESAHTIGQYCENYTVVDIQSTILERYGFPLFRHGTR